MAWEAGFFERLAPRTEAEAIALSVVETGEYSNPFPNFTGPTAHLTPVYPLFLASIFGLFGTGLLAEGVKICLTSSASAFRCALLPLFAIDAGLGPRIGVVAGCLSVAYIGALDTEIRGGTDGSWLALSVLIIVWASVRIWRDERWKTRTPWRFFLLCGFAALLDPSVLAVIGGFVLAGLVACASGWRKRYLLQATLLTSTIAMFLLPWAVRNYLSLDAPIWTRSNFGMEFWISNGPGRTFDLSSNPGFLRHPSNSPAEAAEMAELGEVRYNRLKFHEAMDWARAHPTVFLGLTARRFAAWWFPPGSNPFIRSARTVFSLVALLGFYPLFRRFPLPGWLFLLTWITFPDIYYLIQWSSRYRFPIDWQLLVCASVTLSIVYMKLARMGAWQTAPSLDAPEETGVGTKAQI